MKKILKITLFKKIFLIIFCCFVFIEGLHIYMDFQINIKLEVERLKNSDRDEELMTLIEKYDNTLSDIQLTELMDSCFMATDGYYALTKKRGHDVDIIAEKFCVNYETSLHASFVDGEDIKIDLRDIDIQLLEKYIEQAYKKDNNHQFICYVAGEKIENENEKVLIPQYFCIDDCIFIDNHRKDIMESVSISYVSPSMYYISENPKKYQFLKFSDVLNESRRIVKSDEESQYVRSGDDIYSIESIDSDIKVSYIRYDRGGYSDTLEKTVKDKYIVYIFDFIMAVTVSLFISYMITRNIKKIENITKKIASHHFDETLTVKSKDELGDLSRHINLMSQQLKCTIDQLNDEIQRVTKLETLRQEFLVNFTHEIKTPLGIINGYIELIQDTSDQNKKEQYLAAIEHEVDCVNELVKAMLDLSKLEAGKVELKIEKMDLNDVITVIIDSFASLIQKKHIKINIDGHHAIIQADPSQIGIVIKNILNNAIKHTPEYGCISIYYDENKISIENEGSMLTDEQIENIWETYVSGDRQGTGLGLAICKSILNLHKFGYDVLNTQRGVCFLIKIKE